MKGYKEERLVEYTVVEIDGVKIETKTLRDFFNDVYDINGEKTINAGDNYTSEYIYFPTTKEKELKEVLLKRKVIRESPRYKEWNKKVEDSDGKGFYNYKRYWLDEEYPKFYREVWDILNEIL